MRMSKIARPADILEVMSHAVAVNGYPSIAAHRQAGVHSR